MKRRGLIKRIAGGLLAAVMAVTMAFIPEMGMGGSVDVHAASGQWVMTKRVSLGPATNYRTWMHDGFSCKNNGFDTSDGSWSCTVYEAYDHSEYDHTLHTDMDLKINAPAKSYNSGQKIEVGYKYTMRSAEVSCIPLLYAKFTTDARAITTDEKGNPSNAGTNFNVFCFSDGTETGVLNGNGHDKYAGGESNPNFWAESKIYSTFPKGEKNGDKVYLKLGTAVNTPDMRAVYEYTWKTGSSTKTTLKKPAQTKITSVKIYSKNKKYYRIGFKKIKKNCKGYEFQISDNKKFKGVGKLHQGKWFGVNLNYGYLKGYKYNKTYYVRVRAFNYDSKTKEYKYGKWSKVKAFKWKIK